MSVRRRLAAVVAVLAVALLGSSPSAAASPPVQHQRQVTVATYNLFLGGDVGVLARPEVDTVPEFVAAAAALWQNVVATDFRERARTIARLVAAARPDVVGLQEVALWETAPLGSGDLRSTYDFLALLRKALTDRGVRYRVLVTNTNFTSPVVPVQPVGRMIRFTDRDVVLARAGLPAARLAAAHPRSHTYVARVPIVRGFVDTAIIRGWSSVDVTVQGRTFRFVNTHLEAFSAQVRNAQAAELARGLKRSRYPVVLAGDLNADPADLGGAAHALKSALRLTDAWAAAGTGAGVTAGQQASLRNDPSTLSRRIDYVLVRRGVLPTLRAVRSHVIGEEPADRTRSGMWPSDHAGVVATLHVGRP